MKLKSILKIVVVVIGIVVLLMQVYWKLLDLVNDTVVTSNMYTVVVYNNTNLKVKDVEVLYGSDLSNNINIERADVVTMLPKEYKKINIYDTDFMKYPAPHKVYLKIEDKTICVGYFEQGLGGSLEVVELYLDDDIKFYQYNHDAKYKSILQRHRNNQNELSWYEN